MLSYPVIKINEKIQLKAEWQRAQTLELGRHGSPLQERSVRPANVLVKGGRNTE